MDKLNLPTDRPIAFAAFQSQVCIRTVYIRDSWNIILRSHTFISFAAQDILTTIERQLWQAVADKKNYLP